MPAVRSDEPDSGSSGSAASDPRLNPNLPPPFISKTYDMVDDTSTDAILSWGPNGDNLIIHDQSNFMKVLLPKYFKHNNLQSFVRQLNHYGFRKTPEKMEFRNEHFMKGQKDLLRNITSNRKKHSHGRSQSQQPQAQNTSAASLIEMGQFGGLMGEIEMLKRDKNTLKQEVIRLRQQQQITNNQLQTMLKSIHIMEHRQQLMMSFLAKVVQSPGFFTQFVQQQNESNNKKRRLPSQESASFPDGQIIKYQPIVMNEFMKMLGQIPNANSFPALASMNKVDSFSVDDTQNEPGVTLSEFSDEMEGIVPLSPMLDDSLNNVDDMSEYDAQNESQVTVSDFSNEAQEVVPDGNFDYNPTQNFAVPEDEDILKLIETELEHDDSLPIEVSFDDPAVLEFMNQWIGDAQSNDGVSSVQRADIESQQPASSSIKCENAQNVDNLTAQIRFLTSDSRG